MQASIIYILTDKMRKAVSVEQSFTLFKKLLPYIFSILTSN